MSSESRSPASRNSTPVLLLILALACLVACDGSGSGDARMSSVGPFKLTFILDASFQGPHGGDPIEWAVVRPFDGLIVDSGSGTVSGTQNPSFSFSTGRVLRMGVTYEVHYWIDANLKGMGTPGVCDPKGIDPQWSTEFLSVHNDIVFTVSYNLALTEDVCGTFP